MKKRSALLIAAPAFVLAISLTVFSARTRTAETNAIAESRRSAHQLISGPGYVEPISEDIKIGSELSGKLRSVLVEEGDQVSKGQVLAVLANDDYRAAVLAAQADVSAKEAVLRKLVNGARIQERSEALFSVREAQAVMNNALSEKQRCEKLYAAGVISREDLERYRREYDVAKARYHESAERYSLVDDHAREEDIAFAQAELRLARAQQKEAQAKYEKTFIKSPIAGTVLRKHHRSGESVSNSSTVPDPIVTVGNTAVLRVRVDVDETDVSKVRVGQRAFVTADAYGNQRFWGRVVRVGEQLGPKNVRTDEPTERVDRKILETLLELEPGAELPVGLRMDAYIVGDKTEVAKTGQLRQ